MFAFRDFGGPSSAAENSALLSGVHFMASIQVVNLGQPFRRSSSLLLALKKEAEHAKGKRESGGSL